MHPDWSALAWFVDIIPFMHPDWSALAWFADIIHHLVLDETKLHI